MILKKEGKGWKGKEKVKEVEQLKKELKLNGKEGGDETEKKEERNNQS